MALDGRQLDQLRRKIDERRRALAAEIDDDEDRFRKDNVGELAGPTADPADASVADLIADIDGAEADRDLRELRELEAALARIDQGTYGECVDCGRDIGFERLMAQPTARRCIECQSRYEKTFAVPGAPPPPGAPTL
jgi:RNA polymerase-binding protein DksA